MFNTSTHLPFAIACTIAAATAQQSIVFAVDQAQRTLANGGGAVEAGLIREDESAIFTPGNPGASASVFTSVGAQWAYIGDANNDGRLVDIATTGPGDDIDAVFVPQFGAAANRGDGPRDVFFSKEGNRGLNLFFEDGDVFRFAEQGRLETFISETQILGALGLAPNDDIDTNAFCQSANGDLFLSFADTETLQGAQLLDGSIVMIPASAINYDSNSGIVNAIAGGSAVMVATEAEVGMWLSNSGLQTAQGRSPSTRIDVAALEIDPAGGTWTSMQTGNPMPNLLFGWSDEENNAAILSSRNGGSIATINGVAMGSSTATFGDQLGLLPDVDGGPGLNGLALLPMRAAPLAVENFPLNRILSSNGLFVQQHVSGATAGQPVITLLRIGAFASFAPAISAPSLFGGELFGVGNLITIDTTTADPDGHASTNFALPNGAAGSGINLVYQCFDVASFSLSTPAAMQL